MFVQKMFYYIKLFINEIKEKIIPLAKLQYFLNVGISGIQNAKDFSEYFFKKLMNFSTIFI